jgi:deoxycytidylate deaminase
VQNTAQSHNELTVFLVIVLRPVPTVSLTPDSSEVVIGLVCAVGTDYDQFLSAVRGRVQRFNYDVKDVRLSGFLKQTEIKAKHGVNLTAAKDEYERISRHMAAGNRLREITKRPDILALLAAIKIAQQRGGHRPLERTASVILSLKRPEEVAALRMIYGGGFYLVGMYSSDDSRMKHMTDDRNINPYRAKQLIERDQNEDLPHGQRTRDTFQLADAFVELDNTNLTSFRKSVYRIIDLIFGHPFKTPTRDEHAMFLAYAASLCSADLSRQVGAVVVSPSPSREVIATGWNDVPSPGGSLYGPGPGDQRDHALNVDSNKQEIRKIAEEIARKIAPKRAKASTRRKIENIVLTTRLDDLTEFGRPVHAEMEALLHCARTGVSPQGGDMYVTTFPCHNCAKHIIAAGIKNVYFVEAYAKSRALELHKDAISFQRPLEGRVSFRPFVGVAARRYFDLFSLKLGTGLPVSRKEDDGERKRFFRSSTANPRVPMLLTSVIEREEIASKIVDETMG